MTTIALPQMFSAHATSYIMLNGSVIQHGVFHEFLDNSNHYTGCGELQPIDGLLNLSMPESFLRTPI